VFIYDTKEDKASFVHQLSLITYPIASIIY